MAADVASSLSVEARSGADSGVIVAMLAIEPPVALRADCCDGVSAQNETPESLAMLWMVEVL